MYKNTRLTSLNVIRRYPVRMMWLSHHSGHRRHSLPAIAATVNCQLSIVNFLVFSLAVEPLAQVFAAYGVEQAQHEAYDACQ
ncbi:MAG: hypothetical protein II970_05865 [Paludibacteraceae bacterium]|nr:hypothetical protein [Paludibacteraceae bacterium]